MEAFRKVEVTVWYDLMWELTMEELKEAFR